VPRGTNFGLRPSTSGHSAAVKADQAVPCFWPCAGRFAGYFCGEDGTANITLRRIDITESRLVNARKMGVDEAGRQLLQDKRRVLALHRPACAT